MEHDVKPTRGISPLSLQFAQGDLLDRDVRSRSSAMSSTWDLDEPRQPEQRRKGYKWSEEQPIKTEPFQSSQGEANSIDEPPASTSSDRYKKPKSQPPRPVFEDFRAAETPPPVFFQNCNSTPNPTPSPRTSPPPSNEQPKRPKLGPRGISFPKNFLKVGDDAIHGSPDTKGILDGQLRRGSHTISVGFPEANGGDDHSQEDKRRDLIGSKLSGLKRSSTAGNLEEVKRSSQADERQLDPTEQQKLRDRKASLVAGLKLPQITSFLTEREYRALNKKKSNIVATDHDSVPTSPETPASPKKERPRFFRALSKKSLASLRSPASSPSPESALRNNPFQDSIAPDQRPPPSPSRLPRAFLCLSTRKSQEEASLIRSTHSKGQRTGTFDDSPQISTPHVHYPGFGALDHHPGQPLQPRNSSSQISPWKVADESYHFNQHNPFDKAIPDSLTAPQHLPYPQGNRTGAEKQAVYLPSEAVRINTPPMVKPGKVGQMTGHMQDQWAPGVDDRSHISGSQKVHTPFPMPREGTFVAPDIFGLHSGLDPDYHQVRQNRIVGYKLEIGQDADIRPTEYDTPDHLSNSPLCPASPKHKSGGTGVCIFHGRGKGKKL